MELSDEKLSSEEHCQEPSSQVPSSARSAILQPISTDHLPEAKSDEPLFLPADAQRRWYLGYLHHWKDYQRNVVNHWESAGCKRVFDELIQCETDGPRPVTMTEVDNHATRQDNIAGDDETASKENTVGKDNAAREDHIASEDKTTSEDNTAVEEHTTGEDSTGSAKLEAKVRHEMTEIVETVYNEMLTTWTMKQLDAYRQPERILLRRAGSDSKVRPRFWFHAKPVGQNPEPEARLTGHVEYLGGRPGALTWAIRGAAKNSWGSLRCVLGDVAWCMLKSNTSYGFVVSSDEVIFLRFDVNTCVEEVDINILKPELYPLFDWVDVLEEPHLWYSDPIKFTDALDSAKGEITVKLGLLHLIHEVVLKDWKMQDDKGTCATYFQKTEAGEKWAPKPPGRR